jgi:hypothetical protein
MGGLRILLTNWTMADRHGSVMYLRDLALGLLRQGQRPVIYTPDLGPVGTELKAATVPVVADLGQIGEPPDVIHGHSHPDFVAALTRFPAAPGVFVCHAWDAWLADPPRLPRVLEEVGARPGSVYGRFTDAELYAALLSRDESLFLGLAEELAGAFVRAWVEVVAGDAREGYNPAHDVCRLVLDAAAALAGSEMGRPLRVFDFPLVAGPDDCPAPRRRGALWVRLDEAELARKLAAARGYEELAGEVEDALRVAGEDAFLVECLRPVERWASEPVGETPFYERHGERRVSEGHYHKVLRCRDHIAPLAERLWRFTGARGKSSTSRPDPVRDRCGKNHPKGAGEPRTK